MVDSTESGPAGNAGAVNAMFLMSSLSSNLTTLLPYSNCAPSDANLLQTAMAPEFNSRWWQHSSVLGGFNPL